MDIVEWGVASHVHFTKAGETDTALVGVVYRPRKISVRRRSLERTLMLANVTCLRARARQIQVAPMQCESRFHAKWTPMIDARLRVAFCDPPLAEDTERPLFLVQGVAKLALLH